MQRLFHGLALLGLALLLTACTEQASLPSRPKIPQGVEWLPADKSGTFKVTANVDIIRQTPDIPGYGRVGFRVMIESKGWTSHAPFGGSAYLDNALQPYFNSPDVKVSGPDSSRMVFGLWEGSAGAQGPATGIGFSHDVYVPTELLSEGLVTAVKSPIKLVVWFDRGKREYLEIPSEAIQLTVQGQPITP